MNFVWNCSLIGSNTVNLLNFMVANFCGFCQVNTFADIKFSWFKKMISVIVLKINFACTIFRCFQSTAKLECLQYVWAQCHSHLLWNGCFNFPHCRYICHMELMENFLSVLVNIGAYNTNLYYMSLVEIYLVP